MKAKNMELGDVCSVVNRRKRAKATRPAKVMTWRGWAIFRDGMLCFPTMDRELAQGHAAATNWPLVRVTATLREVG